MREFAFRSPRVNLAAAVDGWTADRSFSGTSHNISCSGLFATVNLRLDVGERVLLHFVLPNLEWPISVLAEVRWTRDPPAGSERGLAVGFRFVSPSVSAIVSIDDLVRTLGEDRTPTDPGN